MNNSQSITRTFWRYSIPAIAALMISGLYMVVDGIFIGHAMGATGLSAINMAWPLSGVMLAIGMMIGMGGGAQCSLAQGAAQWPQARGYLAQALWLLVLLGIPTGVLVVLVGPSFMALQGAENDLAQLGNDYLRVIGWSAPLVFGSIALPLLVRNLGAPRLATLAMLVGALANVALDYLFIIVWQWGLHGAALATVMGESLSVLICLGFICSRHNPLQMPLAACTFNLRKSLDILTTGFSSMLMYLYMSLVVVLHNLLFMHYGSPLQVAAYAIAGYLMAFYYMFAEGVCGGMQPLVSYFYGAREPDKVRRVLRLGLLTAVGSGVLMTAALLLLPRLFAGIFSGSDHTLLDASVLGLRLHLFAMFLDGFIILAASFFQAMGQARYATLVTVGNMLIQLPFLALMPLLLGLNGVWLALPLSNVCLSLVVIWMLRRQLQQLKTLDSPPLNPPQEQAQ
ncbi:Multi antimicrobial extrusion protein (Na(+)/drug antiporter), MATE family of MDR efflux pumps [Pseudomonas sp. 8BK]|uniref:MATE family efflux transporter n=1 Tax=Pseudomonas sp. 8BK TaxID=2653164 RepID=UPI0012F43E03|nr:MATE family efflux transporter [Pseudomonas sp. 8BK]VXB21655.1 Multi antimicrobial extrusion protein (Na(+)/drug antiporter), MATE family of MDR efflux pumps [Pseudomonas sp. 8BK]